MCIDLEVLISHARLLLLLIKSYINAILATVDTFEPRGIGETIFLQNSPVYCDCINIVQ